jgi:hypothetical protein
VSTARVSRATALASLACALGCIDCSRRLEHAARDDDGPQGATTTDRAPRRAAEYELSPGSRLELELGTPERRVSGHVELVRGRLWVEPAALDRTRAELSFDMTTIQLAAKPPADSPASNVGARTLTEQSLDWFEVRDPGALAAHPEHRYAHFSLLQVHSADGNDVLAAPAAPASRPEAAARRVRLRASGELELHGVRLPYTASVLALFEWPYPTLAGPARRIELSTTQPVSIDPFDHDLVPRDGRGDISSDGLALMRRQPSRAARIGLRWTAELAHTGTEKQPR